MSTRTSLVGSGTEMAVCFVVFQASGRPSSDGGEVVSRLHYRCAGVGAVLLMLNLKLVVMTCRSLSRPDTLSKPRVQRLCLPSPISRSPKGEESSYSLPSISMCSIFAHFEIWRSMHRITSDSGTRQQRPAAEPMSTKFAGAHS